MRTATAKTNLKPNELAGIKTLLMGCVNVLAGIVEIFPEHTRGYGTVTGQTLATPAKRGRPKGNVRMINTNGKKVAA